MGSTPSITDQILAAKLEALQDAPVQIMSNLANHQPADSHPFQVNSQPFPAYPAPGANPVQLLSYQVPQGLMCVINELIIEAIGGGFVDGSGHVVWRCWLNGAGIDGYEYITAHIGDFSNYAPCQFVLTENDLFYITAEVPAAQPPMPPGASTGARIRGWTYPLGKAVGQ
jgi:hypothetical protein